MNDDRYVLYDAGSYADLVDDRDFRAYVAEESALLGDGSREPSDNDLWEEATRLSENDLREEAYSISARIDAQVRSVHPEWGSRYLLMVKGRSSSWAGSTSGHCYYAGDAGRPAFMKFLYDNGPEGLFKDCEIDSVWEDRDGTVHVRGVHHDGSVEVAVRAVAPDAEDMEQGLLEWNGMPIAPDAYRHALETTWSEGVRADMAGFYGYSWPRSDERSASPAALASKAIAAAEATAGKGAFVDTNRQVI